MITLMIHIPIITQPSRRHAFHQ